MRGGCVAMKKSFIRMLAFGTVFLTLSGAFDYVLPSSKAEENAGGAHLSDGRNSINKPNLALMPVFVQYHAKMGELIERIYSGADQTAIRSIVAEIVELSNMLLNETVIPLEVKNSIRKSDYELLPLFVQYHSKLAEAFNAIASDADEAALQRIAAEADVLHGKLLRGRLEMQKLRAKHGLPLRSSYKWGIGEFIDFT